MKTLMSSDTKLTKDEECESVDSTKYRGMIGACVFSYRWRLDELAYGQVHRIRHEEEIDVLEYQILTRKIVQTLKPLEEIIRENKNSILPITWENEWSGSLTSSDNSTLRQESSVAAQLGRKVRKDRGTRRGRPSTSSSTFDQPSSSHLNDDNDDENNEGTSRASTPSPIRYVNSLTNQLRDEQRGGLRSIEKGFQKLWKDLKKM
ncbi:hypothetical protein Tco_0763580 [Tanacetum coccineum]